MIRNRLQKQIEFNTPISDEAIDLLKQLLKNNPTDRLGSNGVNEIKQHSFFHDLNWNNLFSQLNYLVIETQEIQILHLSKNNYRILQHNLFLKRITMINSLSKNLKCFLQLIRVSHLINDYYQLYSIYKQKISSIKDGQWINNQLLRFQ
ncbi:unnamed protein product [Paramecium sonneborni]|uniref:Uncharacterized protein n=1 Tax=Paramecium sonneborni TaxID=65129 RepID=A0A8S1RL60_9CILI|nr:unnamed protein product [Paramecium sonneborni]